MCTLGGMHAGHGKHSKEEATERLDADLVACEPLLEDSGTFLTGATPTQADCFLYGFLDHVRCSTALLYILATCRGLE